VLKLIPACEVNQNWHFSKILRNAKKAICLIYMARYLHTSNEKAEQFAFLCAELSFKCFNYGIPVKF
jgi:hypothetical protein